jgi:succinate dehydrogenase / fumarate reductase cytochrome b subunit
MDWKNLFSTSVGKKLQMSLTGLFLITFLLVHCYINAQIFRNDGGKTFLAYAHFMGTDYVIRTVEIGLFAFLIIHTIQGLFLYFRNRSKRNTGYATNAAGAKSSKWYSRSMALLGTLILIFLTVHLSKFWGPNRYSQTFGSGELNLYEMMQNEFHITWVVIFYVCGNVALSWHLLHGFYSAFQTLGLGMSRYKGIIKTVGVAFSIIIPLIFAMMPIVIYFDLIS